MLKTVKFSNRHLSFVAHYRAYLDYLYLYEPDRFSDMVKIEPGPGGVPCFGGFDHDNIIASKGSDVILIDNCFDSMAPEISTYPKDKKYLIISNSWWDPEEYDSGYEYHVLPFNLVAYTFLEYALMPTRINSFIQKRYHYEEHKPNVFCSLIGSRRGERDCLLGAIRPLISYQNHILNYAGHELGASSRDLDIIYDFGKYDSYADMGLPNRSMYVMYWSMPMRIFNSARFNFVVETGQVYHEFHLTEKTLKPLYIGQPFVIFAQRHFLKNLQSMGFRTFGSLWSEEYDDIDDFTQRAQEVGRLLDDLGRFDWNRHRQQLQSITDHNQQVLINLGSTLLPKQMQNISDTLKSCGWF